MKRMVAALAVVGVLTGCGSDADPEAEARAAEASASAEAEAEAIAEAAELEEQREAEEAARLAADRAAREQCQNRTGELIDSLQQIDSRLSVGMNFDEYSDRVGDARVAYDALFRGRNLEMACLTEVAVPLENSLNKYIDVFNIWNDCIGDYNCDFSAGATNDNAQDGWVAARRALSTANRGMRQVAAESTI